jgi:hypothetical protein
VLHSPQHGPFNSTGTAGVHLPRTLWPTNMSALLLCLMPAAGCRSTGPWPATATSGAPPAPSSWQWAGPSRWVWTAAAWWCVSECRWVGTPLLTGPCPWVCTPQLLCLCGDTQTGVSVGVCTRAATHAGLWHCLKHCGVVVVCMCLRMVQCVYVAVLGMRLCAVPPNVLGCVYVLVYGYVPAATCLRLLHYGTVSVDAGCGQCQIAGCLQHVACGAGVRGHVRPAACADGTLRPSSCCWCGCLSATKACLPWTQPTTGAVPPSCVVGLVHGRCRTCTWCWCVHV